MVPPTALLAVAGTSVAISNHIIAVKSKPPLLFTSNLNPYISRGSFFFTTPTTK